MDLDDHLTRRQLIVVTGKGGVGKSAMTAALGCFLAEQGRHTLMLEVDPRENLHQLLDVAPSGGDLVRVRDRLHLQNLKPRRVVDWIVERQIRIGLLSARVLKSPIYERFSEGAPGLTEMAILGHAHRLVNGRVAKAPTIDTVVLDAPATGHGLYLLTAPRLFAEAVGEGPVADIAREVSDFVADRQRCGLVVVTLAEEMPVQEALELRQGLIDRFGREPELLIANCLYPLAPETSSKEPLVALWHDRRQVNERELQRLDRHWSGARVDLPLLPIDRGPELIDALYRRLGRQLTEGEP